MRVLVTSISDSDWFCRPLAGTDGFEIAAFHPRYVQLGDWGESRTDPTEPRPYLTRASRVFPTRPYTGSLYLGGLGRLLREFDPQVLYHWGEPSELGSWQVIRLVRRHCPQARIVLSSLENVVQQWRGFPRCLRGLAERATIPRLDLVIGASVSVVRAWERQGFDPARLRVNYLPIDTERFHRHKADDLRAEFGSADEFVVGYIGRFVPEKGVDVLLRAAAMLPGRYILALEGAGPCEGQLRALAEELELRNRVRWLGRIPSEQVPRYMSAYDALVLPSRGLPVWQEQFGRVLPEGMLCGTPVVGSSCGAIPDVIGEAGLIFPENDAAALAERLRELGEDDVLRADMVQRGYERARREFTIGAHMTRLVEALREAAGLPRL